MSQGANVPSYAVAMPVTCHGPDWSGGHGIVHLSTTLRSGPANINQIL
jgi:hypothetical protein